MNGCVSVNVDRLILGRTLTCPIHGLDGVLLISKGALITSELKEKLKHRGVRQVVVDESKVKGLTVDGVSESLAETEQKLDERLDELIRSGNLSVRNVGASLRHKVIDHGRKNYDPSLCKKVAKQQKDASRAVQSFTREAAEGGDVDGQQVADLSGAFIESLAADISSTLSTSLAARDMSLAEHAVSVANLAMAIGIDLGLDARNVRTIGVAALVMDIGMAEVPRRILETPDLSPIEFLEIEKHAIRTANRLATMHEIPDIVRLVTYQVHERLDGSGYPRGRKRESIHLFARILHVADAYVALTSSRPFRGPLIPHCAMECLLRQAHSGQVDAAVVRSLLHVLSLFPIGSYVVLSDGGVAKVLRSNGVEYVRPIVLLVEDNGGAKIERNDDSALIDLTQSDLTVLQCLPTPNRAEIQLSSAIMVRSDQTRRIIRTASGQA